MQRIYETREDYLEAKRKRATAYNAANCLQFTVKLNRKTDADLVEFFEPIEKKQAYIKKLMREDIERTNQAKQAE